MAILINDNYKLSANKPFDDRYLNISTPWISCEEAILGIPTYRYTGLTINISGDEYWWKDGVNDNDLILKTLGGATNGLTKIGGEIKLGGTLTGDTTIIDSRITPLGIVYGGDYENSFVGRSLVTAQYVTGITSGLTNIFTIANNGLYSTGQEVHLGGDLTGNTIISGINIYNLTLDDINNLSLCSSSATTCATSEMLLRTPNFTLHNGINNVINITSSCNILTDETNSKGFVYANDYSTNSSSNPRWIPDNEYITGLTSGNIGTASNGLTKIGQDVKLGGILCENTTICLGGSNDYSFNIKNSGVTTYTIGEFNSTNINLSTTNINSPFEIGKICTTFNNTFLSNGYINCYSEISLSKSLLGITICGGANNASFRITDATSTPRGIEYVDDYSSTFSNCSLITKEYVDTCAITTLNIATGFTDTCATIILNSANTYTNNCVSACTITATNGLTKIGTNVTLGGTLTGNTNICGAGNNINIGTVISKIGVLNLNTNSVLILSTGTTEICPTGILTLDGSAISVKEVANYDTDKSSSYTLRSIPDVNYVTGLTSTVNLQSVLDAGAEANNINNIVISSGADEYSNGWKMLSTNTTEIYGMEIGSNTTIVYDDIKIANSNLCLLSSYYGNDGQSTLKAGVDNDVSLSLRALNTTGYDVHTVVIKSDATGFTGAVYDGDYSGKYVARSLVDKGYVDGEINSLTGVTSQAITGATNGLTKDGQDVVLGGILSAGGATISGNSNIMCLGTIDSPLFQLYTDSCISTKFNNNVNGDKFMLLNNSSAVLYAEDADSSSRLDVHEDNGIELTFSGTSNAMYYADNYSSLYTARSIPDVAYVTGLTSGIITEGITGATNGLTKVGQDVELGGSLTKLTDICGSSNSLSLGTTVSPITIFTVCSNSGTTLSNNINGNKKLLLNNTSIKSHSETTTSYSEIEVHDSIGMLLTFSGTSNALYYDGDYSLMYNERTLPDVAYVTGITSTIETQVAEGITGATNGLTKIGQDVCLGGALTTDVIISGAHTLALSSLTAFNTTATDIGLTGIVTATGAVHTTSTLGVSGATTISGTLTLNSVGDSDVGTDDVMMIDNNGIVKKTAASTLGEDNNIYEMTIVTTDVTLTTGSTYIQLVNSPTSGVTITLPANPINGQVFRIKDAAGAALTYNVIIGRNGKLIDGNANDGILNTDSGALEVVYNAALGSWFVFSFVN